MTRWKTVAAVVLGLLVAGGGSVAFVGGSDALLQQDEAAASFEVSELSAPNTTEPRSDVTVSAVVSNPNDEEDTQVVTYRFEGTVLAQELVTLGPGESTTVTFEVDLSGLTGGTYVHGIFTEGSGAVAEISVRESFGVSNVTVAEGVAVGEPLTANATITNPNDANSTQTVEVRFDGEVVERRTVELGPGESTTISFAVETNGVAPGDYFVSVLTRDFGSFASVTLEERTIPAPNSSVTISNQSSDGTTVVIDSVTVESGGFVAIHDATLLDGNVVGSVIGVSRYLEPGTYENLTITLFDVPGASFDDRELEDGALVIAMPHFDSGDNERYDFVRTGGQFDGAYTANGSVVIDTAVVGVGDEPPANETDTPGGPPDTPPGNATDTPGGPPATPGNATSTPDDATDTPSNVTDTPATATETPSNETAVTATETPDNETDTPATATETAVTGTAATGTATGTPSDLPGTVRVAFLGALSLLAVPVVRS